MASGSDDESSKRMLAKLNQLLGSESEEDDHSDIECEPCAKIFSSVDAYQKHVASKKHYKVVSRLKSMAKLGKDAPKKKPTDEDGDSDQVDEFHCDVCDKQMSGLKNYFAHVNGSGHAKNLKQLKLKNKIKVMEEDLVEGGKDDEDGILPKPFAKCSTCCKTFYGPEAYQQHLVGIKHKKKCAQLKMVESLKKSYEGMDVDDKWKCEACDKQFDSPIPYQHHLRGAVHQKELQRAETEKEMEGLFEKDVEGNRYVCKECKKPFPDTLSFKSHIANNSHGKQKTKDIMFEFVAANPEIVAMKSVQNISSDEDDDSGEKEDFSPGRFFLVCKLCHVSLSGPENAKDHLQSKKHVKAKMERVQMKALKEKLKYKQNGHPSRGDKTPSGTVNPENGPKRSSTNGGSAKPNPKNSSEIADDFELI